MANAAAMQSWAPASTNIMMTRGRGRGTPRGGSQYRGSRSSDWRRREEPGTSHHALGMLAGELPGGSAPSRTVLPSKSPVATTDRMQRKKDGTSLLKPPHLMELLASPSRGLDAELVTGAGERLSLMNPSTQDQLYNYIRTCIEAHAARYPSSWTAQMACDPFCLAAVQPDQRLVPPPAAESLEKIALLLRKLREAYTASRRAYYDPSKNATVPDGRVMSAYLLSIHVALMLWNVPVLQTSLDNMLQLVLPLIDLDSSLRPIPCSGASLLQVDVQNLLAISSLERDSVPLDSCTALADWAASLKVVLDAVLLLGTSSGAVGRQARTTQCQQLQTFAFWKKTLQEVDWVSSVEPVTRAIRTSNPILLIASIRREPIKSSVFHASMIQHALAPLQARSWNVLQRAYVSVPLPRRLCSQSSEGPGWLDQVLLLTASAEKSIPCLNTSDGLLRLLQNHIPKSPQTGPGTAAIPPALWSLLPSYLREWDEQHRLSLVRTGQSQHLGAEQWTPPKDLHTQDEVALSLRIR